MDDLESELYTYMEAAVDGMMVKARAKLKLIEQEAEEYNAKELAELAKSRGALDREIAAMQRHEEQHKGRVELDVGGVRYVTSVETLRRVPWTFFDAYFSGRYQLDRSEDSSVTVFIDRDGVCLATCWNTCATAWCRLPRMLVVWGLTTWVC